MPLLAGTAGADPGAISAELSKWALPEPGFLALPLGDGQAG